MVLDKIQIRGFYNLSFKAYLFLENRLLFVTKTYNSYSKNRKKRQLDYIIAAYDILFVLLNFCYRFTAKRKNFKLQ
jgi:hypothetical protein